MRYKQRELRVQKQKFLVLQIVYGIKILLFRVIFYFHGSLTYLDFYEENLLEKKKIDNEIR